MWLRVLEVWLTARLLASPTFHRGVRNIHKKVHELRHGPDPAEMNRGTKIDAEPGAKGFIQHFIEELKDQAKGATKNK